MAQWLIKTRIRAGVRAAALACVAIAPLSSHAQFSPDQTPESAETDAGAGFEFGARIDEDVISISRFGDGDIPRLGEGGVASLQGGNDDGERIAVGARYSESFADYSFSVAAGVGAFDADGEPRGAFVAGAGVEVDGFEFRGTYEAAGAGGGFGDAPLERFSVGGTYADGPFVIGLTFDMEGEGARGEDAQTRRLSLGAGLTMGDRVTAGWSVEWSETSCESLECPSENSFGGGVLLGIVF